MFRNLKISVFTSIFIFTSILFLSTGCSSSQAQRFSSFYTGINWDFFRHLGIPLPSTGGQRYRFTDDLKQTITAFFESFGQLNDMMAVDSKRDDILTRLFLTIFSMSFILLLIRKSKIQASGKTRKKISRKRLVRTELKN